MTEQLTMKQQVADIESALATITAMIGYNTDNEHNDKFDDLDVLGFRVYHTLEVEICAGRSYMEARIPIVRGSHGWEPVEYGSEISGRLGGCMVRWPLPDDVAKMLVERYAGSDL
jgi:hypothetical protein